MDLQRLRLLQQLYEAHRLNLQNQIVIAQILVDRQRRHRPRPRWYWMKPWLSRRLDYGHYDCLMRELEAEDVVSFRNFVRMDPAMFREVLQRVGPRIGKYDTWYRKSINPGCRLAITLRFLATGEKYRSLMFGFRVAHNTISVIVRQTCEASWQNMVTKSCSVPIPVMHGSRLLQNFLPDGISITPWRL